jgi:hypothetical protein
MHSDSNIAAARVGRGRLTFCVVLAVFASACGRYGYNDRLDRREGIAPDAATIPAPDANVDVIPFAAPWEGPFTLSSPEPVSELNSEGFEGELFISRDGRQAYFGSTRDGRWKVFEATRTDITSPFQNVRELVELNGTVSDTRLITSGDGLTGYLATNRIGGPGLSDIWVGTRASTDVPFESASFAPMAISTPFQDYDMWLSVDELRLYFVVTTVLADGGIDQDVVMSTRATVADPFGSAQPVGGINTPSNEDNPALSPDELFIVFSTNRAVAQGGSHDIWYARRASVDAPFDPPEPLPGVNTPGVETEVFLSPAGDLYFASDRPGSLAGGRDFYRSTFLPTDAGN